LPLFEGAGDKPTATLGQALTGHAGAVDARAILSEQG
jgi:hypothetical protein